jgi:hypothetical protein
MQARPDDFSGLDASRHMLPWVGLDEDDPYRELRGHFEGALVAQDPGSVLEWVRMVGEPELVTGGRPADDGAYVVVTRAGLAFAFELSVVAGDLRRWPLRGVANLVGVRLDRPGEARFQFHFDVDADLETLTRTGVLTERLYALDADEG